MKEMNQSGGGGGMFRAICRMYNSCQYKFSVSNNQHKRRDKSNQKHLVKPLTWQIIAKPIERGSLDYFCKKFEMIK
jgi:hypothetical protein